MPVTRRWTATILTNIVFVESGSGQNGIYTEKGYSGVRQLITIVPNADDEERFFTQVMGMDQRSKNLLKGPSIEKMVGLPPGTALDIRIVGGPEANFGLFGFGPAISFLSPAGLRIEAHQRQ